MNARHLRQYVVIPTLKHLSPDIPFSEVAVELLMGTAAKESHLEYIDQLAPGPGPAYGLWQMEEVTHDDCWKNWLEYRPELSGRIKVLMAFAPTPVEQLRTNLMYACAMSRVYYRRIPEPLPKDHRDVASLARYWKRYYNTEAGKGTVAQFIDDYKGMVA